MRRKVAKWLQHISLFCRLEQDIGVDLMCKLTLQMAQGQVCLAEWNQLISETWFICKNDEIVGQFDSQWKCIESKIDGDSYSCKNPNSRYIRRS